MLEVLVDAAGGVVSAEELLERAWDENADPFTNAVRITVSSLRKRLGEPWLILTVPGVGYRIATDADGRMPAARMPAPRRRGMSARLKLTLSYAGCRRRCRASALLAVVALFLLRYVPDVQIPQILPGELHPQPLRPAARLRARGHRGDGRS